MGRGRPKGQIIEKKEKPKGYIVVNDDLRIRVEADCLTLEEKTGEDTYGNYSYFTSWDGVLNYIIRRFTMEKVSKVKLVSFIEAKKLILDAIFECKSIFLGEIEKQMKLANKEIKENIKKFNI